MKLPQMPTTPWLPENAFIQTVYTTLIGPPDVAHSSQLLGKALPRTVTQVFFRGEQIQQRYFHKIPFLPSRMWDAQPIMLDVLIAVKYDV